MIIDNNLVMSDAQAMYATNTASTSCVDLLAAGEAISPGARLKVQVNTAYADATLSPTLAIALETDSDPTFNTSKVVLVTTAALLSASLTAGAVPLDVVIPKGVKRYLRVYGTVAGTGSFSAGKIDARIVLDTDNTMDKNL